MATAPRDTNYFSFGPYNLAINERLLTRNGAPVRIGARALDLLITLVASSGDAVSKKELMRRVWPDAVVEEGSLRFHVAALRKALGDGTDGARYIATLAGRGYRFVAPLVSASDARGCSGAAFTHTHLPTRLSHLVGRDDDLVKVSAELTGRRFVTIVGAGGVGKTTVAVALAHQLSAEFCESVLFVDLGVLNDPQFVPSALASLLGLSVPADDPLPNLIGFFRDKRILLILDTCEHVINAVAPLAATLVSHAPDLHVLATSREALQADGEHVYRLEALACPPDDRRVTAAAVWSFPATRLFAERAVASGARLSIGDAEAAIVADICRKLDGVALAIELAARRVQAYGLQQTAALLDDRLALVWRGARTAPARQKTVHAALDWSYQLLSAVERTVLVRLAVFTGPFTLDAALDVVPCSNLDRLAVVEAIDSLVAKSLVSAHLSGAAMSYRLLDTTRSYALDIGLGAAEAIDLAVRHAAYYRRWLEQAATEWAALSNGVERTPHFAALSNVRAALNWAFDNNPSVGVALSAAAAPVFLATSSLAECCRWTELAIEAIDGRSRGSLLEAKLQTALGVSLMFTRGGQVRARVALDRALAIAREHRSVAWEARALGPLSMFALRAGNFREARQQAARCSELSAPTGDDALINTAHSVLGTTLHMVGELALAQAEFEAAIDSGMGPQRWTTTVQLGFEGRFLAGSMMARTLWLRGFPDQATSCALEVLKSVGAMNHALTSCIALIWAISTFIWNGDLRRAESYVDEVIWRASINSFAPYLILGRGFQGELAIRRGRANDGVEILRGCLQTLHDAPYELLTTPLAMALAEGLLMTGDFDGAQSLTSAMIDSIDRRGDVVYLPELLRLQGRSNADRGNRACDLIQAEKNCEKSLQISRAHGSRAWALRAATDLASLWAGRGRRADAGRLLRPVLAEFTEGFDTSDLVAAADLIKTFETNA